MAPLMHLSDVRRDWRHISDLRVVVHSGYAIDGGDNHWSMYLLFQNGKAVRVNIMADFGDPTGRIEWSDLEYALPHSTLGYWDYPIAENVRVQDVADCIYQNGRNRFDFHPAGSGCRYWMVVRDFVDRGYVDADTPNQLWEPLQYFYRGGRDPLRTTWVEGHFY